ncbi:MAG: MerR family transcriptional regulator [Bacilli bacterium]|nr:MerR family transcriptional regulator [Bacilli bacterium]
MIHKNNWKVGELAKRTGITVRALHHYDQIGLISPSRYSDTGHRLYSEADIAKLQQIMSLKDLGFALEEIKALIEKPGFKPDEVIRMQLERLNKQIQIQEQLRSRLEGIYELLNAQLEVTAEQFIKLIEVMKMNNKYFTPEQLESLKKRGEQLGPEKIRDVENEWPELLAKVRTELEKGTPPENPEVVQLAKRWKELMDMFSGGDPEIIRAGERFHVENPDNALQFGLDAQLYKYISQAISNL